MTISEFTDSIFTDMEYIAIISRLIQHGLTWDKAKATLWLGTENPNLGGAKPISMILNGRGHKVLKFVIAALEENEPPHNAIAIDPKRI